MAHGVGAKNSWSERWNREVSTRIRGVGATNSSSGRQKTRAVCAGTRAVGARNRTGAKTRAAGAGTPAPVGGGERLVGRVLRHDRPPHLGHCQRAGVELPQLPSITARIGATYTCAYAQTGRFGMDIYICTHVPHKSEHTYVLYTYILFYYSGRF